MAVFACLMGLAARLGIHRTLRLGDWRLRFERALIASLMLSALLPAALGRLGAGRPLIQAVWAGLMLGLLLFSAANSRVSTGFLIVAVGVGLNLLVVILNGGMPVMSSAAYAAGSVFGVLPRISSDSFHVLATASTRLPVLADVLPVPGPQPIRSLVSVGDVLMCAGVAMTLAWAPVPAIRESVGE